MTSPSNDPRGGTPLPALTAAPWSAEEIQRWAKQHTPDMHDEGRICLRCEEAWPCDRARYLSTIDALYAEGYADNERLMEMNER